MFYYEEKVVLTQDYTDNLGNCYKKGQTGTIRSTPSEEDKTVILVLDGYEKSKMLAKQIKEKKGESPNIVNYITEIPINILKLIGE